MITISIGVRIVEARKRVHSRLRGEKLRVYLASSLTLESRPASRLFSTNAYVRALKEARVPATLPYSNSFFFFLFFSFFFFIFFIFFSRTLRRRLSRAAAARCSGSTYNYHPTLETLYRVFEVVGEFR